MLAASVADGLAFTLVVDDVHLLTNEACWDILALLLDHVPPGAHVCVSGRADALLPLARLRAEGRLLEVGPAELAFTSAETHGLLALHGADADLETAVRLTQVTEGWPVGVNLAVLAAEDSSAQDILDRAHGDRFAIARAIRAPRCSASSHLRWPTSSSSTSILERLSPRLCNAVTENDTAGELRLR